ncbi:class I SAM-dependent methyltransferase [Ramlibacter sp. AN1015]|uniref:class I SAM-dependent methyltransferase n=1 Tax=Ramlibacter sp. AN1015 TaxID=3133428 RepID=UPI0030BEB697
MSTSASHAPSCRACGTLLHRTFVDLGMSPACEAIVAADQLHAMEPFYPLHVFVCEHCLLVQLDEYIRPEHIFSEYAYFSSYSDSWLAHAKAHAETMTRELHLGAKSRVIELASNDGYLLQYFAALDIPVLGIEPALNVAREALRKGIPTVTKFFGRELAQELVAQEVQADLLVANNVLAHVPDVRSFVAGMKLLIKPGGIATIEFPHLARLIEGNQFDTIYHEHFSYFSFLTARRLLAGFGLTVFDVEELATHGGSLRLHVCHEEDASRPICDRVHELAWREEKQGFARLSTYASFAQKVQATKRQILQFLIDAKARGRSVVGYGAPGKGNTLLNYCGIRTDFIDYVVDRNPYKHGKYLPGTHIPVFPPERIRESRPDFVVVMPWNLKDEIQQQLAYVRNWGGRLVVFIPEVEVLE